MVRRESFLVHQQLNILHGWPRQQGTNVAHWPGITFVSTMGFPAGVTCLITVYQSTFSNWSRYFINTISHTRGPYHFLLRLADTVSED